MTNAQHSNVISMEKPQAEAKPARFTISAMIDGFPVQVEVEGRADNLRAMIDRLKAIGVEPPQSSTPAQAAQGEPTKKSAPVCPLHRTPMKASRKPGSFFCPRRADDGDFCPEKA